MRSSEADFAREAEAEQAIVGAAPNRPIGQAPEQGRSKAIDVEDPAYDARAGAAPSCRRPRRTEPFAGAQWDMRMIGATPERLLRAPAGPRASSVGIIDTGIEGSHPDIAPNFNAELSRNFTFDIPKAPNGETVDGPCEEEADESCTDAPDVDDDGHGTHVAGTIGAADQRQSASPASRRRSSS